MSIYEERDAAHAEQCTDIERMIGVDDVLVYPVEGGGAGIEVSRPAHKRNPSSDVELFVILADRTFSDLDDAFAFAEHVKAKLDWYEEQGISRNEQQLYVAGELDQW